MSEAPTKLVLFSEVNSKFGVPFLLKLAIDERFSVEALVTSPEGKLCPYYLDEPDPVDLEAEARSRGIEVFRPDDVNSDELHKALESAGVDYFIVANYQQIFKAPLLAVPSTATVNFHVSPLPRYAGRAPFFWMAKNGEQEGGVSAILIDEEIDGGPLIAQLPIPLSGTETALEIRNLHFAESVRLLEIVLDRLAEQDLSAVPQEPNQRTYYGKVSDQDLLVNWSAGVEQALRTIRAGHGHSGAFTFDEHGEKVTIFSAEWVGAAPDLPTAAEPGEVHRYQGGIAVFARDGWIRLVSVRVGDAETCSGSEEAWRSLGARHLGTAVAVG